MIGGKSGRGASSNVLVKPTSINPKLRLEAQRRKRIQSLLRKVEFITDKAAQKAPHLYAQKFYSWAREFFESRCRLNFLVAANQVGKSSFNIRKLIHWATDTQLRPLLWPKVYKFHKHTGANLFWYLYPSAETATSEFKKKWMPLLVLDDPSSPFYCKPTYDQKKIKELQFVNVKPKPVDVIFKFYGQDRINLQSNTVHAVFLDEEIPVKVGSTNLWDELLARTIGCKGYVNYVFTATIAQEKWRRVMEETGERELYKTDDPKLSCYKRRVELYDCLTYEDGDPDTPWDNEAIEEVKAIYRNKPKEIQKRVYGRFVQGEGLVYYGFDEEFVLCEDDSIGGDWRIISGVDIGSGGTRDPAAIVFLAVSSDKKHAKVIKIWKGDETKETSTVHIFDEYIRLRNELFRKYKRGPYIEVYDSASKDFELISRQAGGSFIKAVKDKEAGIETLNSLMQLGMLKIVKKGSEDLVSEFYGLTVDAMKKRAPRVRDLTDALRYAVMSVLWDLDNIKFGKDKHAIDIQKDNQSKSNLVYLDNNVDIAANNTSIQSGDYINSRMANVLAMRDRANRIFGLETEIDDGYDDLDTDEELDGWRSS